MIPVRAIRRRAAAAVAGDWPPHVPPLLQRVYAARGACDLDSARPRLARLHPPDTLGGIDAAVALLAAAIADGARILVVGDFDCDGATACAVAVRGLRMLGARDVVHAVPNRLVHGYGLSPALVEELAPLRPDPASAPGYAVLMTVDHGIACHDGIAAAKAQGWRVVVTDHHLPGPRLPPADAIVNPNLDGDAFPSKALAGVGVMFYVLLALRRWLYSCDHPDREDQEAPPDLAALLDLVAVGTVADLVPLDGNNRALVAAGLRRLRAGHGCAGLQALIALSGRDPARLTAADIGYAIAPRINAAGRLEHMALGIECLLCDEPAQARTLAATLDGINAERRGVQQAMVDQAEAEVARRLLALAADAFPAAVCVFDRDWHPGVVGLVASKLKERLHRPVIAFAPAEPGCALLRGSARSIPGFHIRDALAALDVAAPGLIARFGGHAMAAGLSLAHAQLPTFERLFAAHAERTLDPAVLQAVIDSDGELAPHEFDRAHAEALRDGGPWGQGFPEPLFDGEFGVLGWRVIAERHLRLELDGGGQRLNAIHFGGWNGEAPPSRLRLAYRLAVDDYRGGQAIQLIVEYREAA